MPSRSPLSRAPISGTGTLVGGAGTGPATLTAAIVVNSTVSANLRTPIISTTATTPVSPLFALELTVFSGIAASQPFVYGHGSHPHGAATMFSSSTTSTDTLRASDQGYRTRVSDAGGVQVYPGVMDQAFEIERHLSFDPTKATSFTYGTIRLFNIGQRYDTYIQTRNSDSRAVKLLLGQKSFDESRGVWVDPPYASLTSFFAGYAGSWQLSEDTLEIPLHDATYWADISLQTNSYTGAGGLGGTSQLAGLPKPMTRGGTFSNPVLNVPLVTVDPINLIYQWTDGAGTVVNLYEGGAAVFAYDGDVPDLYSGATPAPGHFRTNNANGVLQLGSSPVRALTADVTGKFSTSGTINYTAVKMAYWVLRETMAVPSTLIDAASFDNLDGLYPHFAGFYQGTTDVPGLQIVEKLLGCVAARMIGGRSGNIKAIPLRLPNLLAIPSLALSAVNIVENGVTPLALPTDLDPPPYRWRVGYNKNWSVQTSDFDAAVTEGRKSFLANPNTVSTWLNSIVQATYPRPNDPAVVDTFLLTSTGANELAYALGTLLQDRPGYYTVEVPMDIASSIDIGSVVSLKWPLSNLVNGALVQVTGEQIRSFDATCKFSVLVASGTATPSTNAKWDAFKWNSGSKWG
jgi:hypothetical protein